MSFSPLGCPEDGTIDRGVVYCHRDGVTRTEGPLQAILGWVAVMSANHHDHRLVTEGLDVQRIQLPSVVESAVAMVRPAATAKRMAIAEDFDDSIGPIDADPTRLQHAFGNVLSNAGKFTPAYGHKSGAAAEGIPGRCCCRR